MHDCAAQITHEMNSAASASTSGQGPQAPPSAASADMAAVLHPTDMEVEVEDSLLIDHEAPAERTDADFFNGATPRAAPRRVRPPTRALRWAASICTCQLTPTRVFAPSTLGRL